MVYSIKFPRTKKQKLKLVLLHSKQSKLKKLIIKKWDCYIIVILIFMCKEEKIQLLQYMLAKCLQDNLSCENFVVLWKN